MADFGSGSIRFHVNASGAVAKEIKQLRRRADRRGQGPAFVVAFRRIVALLERRPMSVGEPLHTLDAMGLRIRVIVVAPLVIHYSVNEAHRIVWRKSGSLLAKGDA